jgi:FkbM family methyltransferase
MRTAIQKMKEQHAAREELMQCILSPAVYERHRLAALEAHPNNNYDSNAEGASHRAMAEGVQDTTHLFVGEKPVKSFMDGKENICAICTEHLTENEFGFGSPSSSFRILKILEKEKSRIAVKIDVEGHEITVLKGMLPFLEQYKPAIIIEIIGDENAEVLNALFKKLEYEFISIDEVTTSVVVDKLWDNDHHNFLLCDKSTLAFLQSIKLVQ